MKQIRVSDGSPGVFEVFRYEGGESWLDSHWAKPDDRWDPGSGLVFRPRKSL